MPDPLPIHEGLVLPGASLTYEFSRSGGPGGQHVNTADTRVRLRFALDACTELSEPVKRRLRAAFPGRVTEDGELLLTCDSNRSRHRNIEEVRARLVQMVQDHLRPPRPRKATKPSRAVHQRRLNNKKRRGSIKRGRGRVSADD